MNNDLKILEAAIEIFSEKGYSAASMREIASRVGIKASSIYNHYKSKEDIFFAIINKFSKGYQKIIDLTETGNYIEEPLSFLKELARVLAFLDRSEKDLQLHRIMFVEQIRVTLIRQELIKKLEQAEKILLPKVLKDLQDAGKIKKMDLDILSREYFYPLFMHRLKTILFQMDEIDKAKQVEEHVEFFWNAIKL